MNPKFFFLISLSALSLYLGCNVPTSHENDDSLYAGGSCSGSAQFCSFLAVVEEKCIACHTGAHNDWAPYKTEDDWVNLSGEVVPGSPNASGIFTSLTLNGGDMPFGGFTFTVEENAIFEDWINSL
jgi:hypothetical protein